ncbi:hypothetical protein SAMN04490207_0066 [Pseudomonas gessardii]|nr:hypothetical protein SAMN04490207_0066 [Pseudomonas gessardii]
MTFKIKAGYPGLFLCCWFANQVLGFFELNENVERR